VDWQLPVTLSAVASAGTYLSWRSWRIWRASRKGCGGDCGCHQPAEKDTAPGKVTIVPVDLLTARMRPKQ
jgi:hypothetical protein